MFEFSLQIIKYSGIVGLQMVNICLHPAEIIIFYLSYPKMVKLA